MDAPVVLLDLDGTLTDPKVGITRSVQHALRSLGRDVDDLGPLIEYIGPPLRESFVTIHGVADEDVERAVQAYREHFASVGLFENEVYGGVGEVLAALAAAGVRLGVATSKPSVFAERILEHFGLRGWFEVVAGAELDGRRSRKAEVIGHALEQLGRPPDRRCVMVGDRRHDVEGAHEVGISSIGVLWGYGGVEELILADADRLAATVDELPALIAELTR